MKPIIYLQLRKVSDNDDNVFVDSARKKKKLTASRSNHKNSIQPHKRSGKRETMSIASTGSKTVFWECQIIFFLNMKRVLAKGQKKKNVKKNPACISNVLWLVLFSAISWLIILINFVSTYIVNEWWGAVSVCVVKVRWSALFLWRKGGEVQCLCGERMVNLE